MYYLIENIMSRNIRVGDRVRLSENVRDFEKGHEFNVIGSSRRGFDLRDDNGTNMAECLFIHDKLELVDPDSRIATDTATTDKEPDFTAYTYEVFDKDDKRMFVHWADGLKMIIRKGDVFISLNSEEIQKLVKALPKTFGGSY